MKATHRCFSHAIPSRLTLIRRDLVFVLIMNTVIAVSLNYGFQTGGTLWHNFVYSQLIGLSIWALIDIPRVLLWSNDRPPSRAFVLLAVVAVPMGVLFGSWATRVALDLPPKSTEEAGGMLRMCLVVGMLGAASMIYFYWSRERLAFLQRQMALDALQREEAEKQLVRAQLMALQAQIEPHFLFNSLAHLDGLIATDPPAARRLLQCLIGFLRRSLAHTRAEQCTLRQEFALLRSYLDIQALRFGARLSYDFVLPEELAEVEIPPMLIQPLVENAVTHGIEPCVTGGHITVSARALGDAAVQVVVADTGVGFGQPSAKGSGLGLTHVRERLARLFGANASMQIEENAPRGVVVRLTVPILMKPQAASAQEAVQVRPSCGRAPAPSAAPQAAATGGTVAAPSAPRS
ncbi:hypothetical protein L602_000600000640 [Cupriavidus gilardii J11]|uniref:Histidine kinase/HSP90-like ATPase domain-containing protein n=1 Tax=Cupriavidus gilardii J11 TaxID=936133 RepID=A0A562B3K9_9BURK|nr:sensor histidine kinase [Cupriavidus gilardii]TWG79664.1 hypothetical protein L602_000600000640 [Cupriavidus gilardii J11]